jgi:GNAT superfamily N-acetyltransferase
MHKPRKALAGAKTQVKQYSLKRRTTTKIIYKASKPDPKQYMDLFKTTGWNKTYKASIDELAAALKGSWCVISAYEEDELVGIGRVVSDGVLYAMIYDMIVKPTHQGKGIGTAILSQLVERCQVAGLRDVQLFSAKGKADFYAKRCFVKRPAYAPGMRLLKK